MCESYIGLREGKLQMPNQYYIIGSYFPFRLELWKVTKTASASWRVLNLMKAIILAGGIVKNWTAVGVATGLKSSRKVDSRVP